MADQRDKLTASDVQVDVAQGLEAAFPGIEVFADLGQLDEFCHLGSPASGKCQVRVAQTPARVSVQWV
ncbi:hypothetical protein D3C85_1860020 [compost metagenome]